MYTSDCRVYVDKAVDVSTVECWEKHVDILDMEQADV
jgi:hypothetical protein